MMRECGGDRRRVRLFYQLRDRIFSRTVYQFSVTEKYHIQEPWEPLVSGRVVLYQLMKK